LAIALIRDWIEQAAARQGGDVYLADARGPATLTYAQLLNAVRDAEYRLDRAGLPRGARIAVRLREPLDYATALVAIIAAGRVAVPLDPGAPAADVTRVLGLARAAATVVNRAGGDEAGPGASRADGDGEVTGPFGRPAFDFDRAGFPAPVPGEGGGIFLGTSGTTGPPKGILLGEAQLAHVAASVVACHGFTAGDRGYCPLPLFHVNAEVVGVLAALRAGAYLALDRKFSRSGFWDMIGRNRITWINAVPAIISILALDPPAVRPSGLRFVRSASAPLPLAALERFEAAIGVPVVETYGMTEAASMITANPVGGPRKPGSAGRAAGAEVSVRRPGGGSAAPGEIGRVRIRGAGVITRYDSGQRPGAIDADGWLDTGDLGYLDADGFLFLAGRSDDVINRGGEKIYPREIEEVLLAHPGVRSAAVIGEADEVLGERPVAYIVPDGDLLPAEIEAALAATCSVRLPRHKQPSAYCLVEEMPLGPTGKISRRLLRDLVTARS
jgi:acyl-CoA synthetase (AMP-forming)/AMP-acid ligase II